MKSCCTFTLTVDDAYPELKERYHGTCLYMKREPEMGLVEYLKQEVLPENGFWYQLNDEPCSFIIWHYEGIEYMGKYKLTVELSS